MGQGKQEAHNPQNRFDSLLNERQEKLPRFCRSSRVVLLDESPRLERGLIYLDSGFSDFPHDKSAPEIEGETTCWVQEAQ